jgi:hypothetical protein
MLEKTDRQAIVAAARAAGITLDKITAMLAVAEDRTSPTAEFKPLVVNQATAAKLISASRFLVRSLVQQGKLHQVVLAPRCIRYSLAELESLAASPERQIA